MFMFSADQEPPSVIHTSQKLLSCVVVKSYVLQVHVTFSYDCQLCMMTAMKSNMVFVRETMDLVVEFESFNGSIHFDSPSKDLFLLNYFVFS